MMNLKKLISLQGIAFSSLSVLSAPVFALNVLLTNDDGLTSNLKALYDALKARGDDVIVSVPCTGQSGRGAAIVMYSTNTIVLDNDKTQLEAEGGCHNGAAKLGEPAVGPFTRQNFTNGDFYYVHGTPVMATLYGLDVLAQTRWGKAPDVVLSGPNEGQNVGPIVISSGTVNNAIFAANRYVPAIALSAGLDTVDNTSLNAPESRIVAELTLKLLGELQAKANKGQLLPKGVALNVNFPNSANATTAFAFSRTGSFALYDLKFRTSPPWGATTALNTSASATPQQAQDEAAVIQRGKTSITVMQTNFDHSLPGVLQLRLRLNDLLKQ
jgi:5'-nucleotidase